MKPRKSSSSAKLIILVLVVVVLVGLILALSKSKWIRKITTGNKNGVETIPPPTPEQLEAGKEFSKQINDYIQQKYQK